MHWCFCYWRSCNLLINSVSLHISFWSIVSIPRKLADQLQMAWNGQLVDWWQTWDLRQELNLLLGDNEHTTQGSWEVNGRLVCSPQVCWHCWQWWHKPTLFISNVQLFIFYPLYQNYQTHSFCKHGYWLKALIISASGGAGPHQKNIVWLFKLAHDQTLFILHLSKYKSSCTM